MRAGSEAEISLALSDTIASLGPKAEGPASPPWQNNCRSLFLPSLSPNSHRPQPVWTDALLKDTDARIKRYAEAITLQSDDFLKLVERYGITWTLLPPDRPVVQLLDHLPDWRRLYADKIAVVHVRDGHTRP